MTELRKLLSDGTPLLEKALRETEAPQYEDGLQLRASVCGLATAALQLYARNHGLELDRRIKSSDKAPRGLNSRKLQHVVLFDRGDMIDPSYGQFFAYIGLSREAVRSQPRLGRLYPDEKIAIIGRGSSRSFADEMAAHMHAIEPEVDRYRKPNTLVYPPEGSLVGTTLDEKKEVLRDIWGPAGYDSFSLSDQSSSFHRRALGLVMRMHELERSRR